jgi:L-amino acid N-acyltransferase YncA
MADPVFQSRDGRIRLERYTSPPSGFLEFLQRTVWGTGNVRYAMLDVAEHLKSRQGCCYLALFQDDVLAGTYVVMPRTIRVGARTWKAFYRDLLAVDPQHAGTGLGWILVREARRLFLEGASQPVVVYGLIEAENQGSLALSSRAGYERWGSFIGVPFTRLSPADDPRIEPVSVHDLPSVVDRLSRFYREEIAWDFTEALQHSGYFALRSGAEILAGSQMVIHRWRIEGLQGIPGYLFRNVLPRLPFTRRFGSPDDCSFAFFGSLYASPGHERDLLRLLEALLARAGLHAGLVYVDPRGRAYDALLRGGGLGLLHRLGLMERGVLMASAANLAPDDEADIRKRPFCPCFLDDI